MLLCIWPLQGSISFCIFIFYIIYYFCSCSNEPTLIVLSLSVVAVLLCIVLPATASDVLRCTGERQSDGQFYFNMTYDLKEGVDDCETQWVINVNILHITKIYSGKNKDVKPSVSHNLIQTVVFFNI